MTAFTRTWNTAYEQVPADTDDASEGAQRIRNSREDTRERIEVDHAMAGDADDGAHKKITFVEQASDPTFVANRGFLYCKDDSGDTELYYMDDIGTVMQVTKDGLFNPALITAAQEPHTLDNIKVDASVAANALTVALKNLADADPSSGDPVKIALRSSTITDGKYNIRSITGALSIVVPQGATLGYDSSEAHEIQVFAIDNAGTVELALAYVADSGTGMPDESALQTTTVINSSSDSSNTLYSTTARSNVPIRHIGTITIQTGATEGDWSNAPTAETAMYRPAVQLHQMEEIPGAKLSSLVSGSYRITLGAEESHNGTSFAKMHEFYCGRAGVVNTRFYIDHKTVGGVTTYGTIYVNGVAVGTARSNATADPVYYDEDITVAVGDLIQLYTRTSNGSWPVFSNFNLYCDESVDYMGAHLDYGGDF